MTRITIEHANGERERFSLPDRVGPQVADAMCAYEQWNRIEVEYRGGRYVLQNRVRTNPLWIPLNDAGEPIACPANTSHGVEIEDKLRRRARLANAGLNALRIVRDPDGPEFGEAIDALAKEVLR